MPVRRRRPVVKAIVAVVGFGVLYAGLLVLYYFADNSASTTTEDSEGNVQVTLHVVGISASSERLSLAVDTIPPASFFEADGFTLNRDLTLVIDPSSESRQLDYAAGQTPSVTQVELVTFGDIRNWPVDHYETDLVVGVYEGSGDNTQLLPITVTVEGDLQGWRLAASETDIPQLDEPFQTMRVELRRSGDTLVFAVILLAVLAAMPLITLFVSGLTFLGRRAVQPTFMSWMAAMLFATIPIRNFLPGSPPPGSWIDAILVLWVIVALIVSLALYAGAWWRQFKPPG